MSFIVSIVSSGPYLVICYWILAFGGVLELAPVSISIRQAMRVFAFAAWIFPVGALALANANHEERWHGFGIDYFLILLSLLLSSFIGKSALHTNQSWALQMMRFQFAILFTATGLSKPLNSGLGWAYDVFPEILWASNLSTSLFAPKMNLIPGWIFYDRSLLAPLGWLVLAIETFGLALIWTRRGSFIAGLGYLSFFIGQIAIMGWTFYPVISFLPLFFFRPKSYGEESIQKALS
jgi:hypothetical protein